MAKKRTMNEYRQTKEHYISPVKQIMAQQIDEDLEATKQMADIDLNEVKDEIVDKLTKDLHDIFFEHVCDEMNKYRVFDIENYIIDIDDPTLPDELQDAWFEYYHGAHGDILGKLIQKITN